MIYIACALYHEAKPYIEYFELKKDKCMMQKISGRVEIFSGSKATVIITGCGKMRATIGITVFFEHITVKHGDYFVNIGSSAALNLNTEKETICLVNKIGEIKSGLIKTETGNIVAEEMVKDVYPDILYRHPFVEKALLTSDLEFKKINSVEDLQLIGASKIFNKYDIYDMEASGVFYAASQYFKIDKIIILKIVTDNGIGDNSDDLKQIAEQIKRIMRKSSDFVSKWLENLPVKTEKDVLNENDKEKIEKISQILGLSETMKYELIQKIKYYVYSGNSASDILDAEWMPNEKVAKREGKKYLERIDGML